MNDHLTFLHTTGSQAESIFVVDQTKCYTVTSRLDMPFINAHFLTEKRFVQSIFFYLKVKLNRSKTKVHILKKYLHK